MLSAFFLTIFILCAVLLFAVLAAVASVFRVAFTIVWWPLKIVGILAAGALLLVVGIPIMAVAIPVLAVAVPILLIIAVIAIPFLIIGGLFMGGLSLVGLA